MQSRSKSWYSTVFFGLGVLFVIALYVFTVQVQPTIPATTVEGKIVIVSPSVVISSEGDASITDEDMDSVDHIVTLDPPMRDVIGKRIMANNPKLTRKVAFRLADAIIDNYRDYGLPIHIQLGLVKNESRFKQYARGKGGDMGFFQVVYRIHKGRINDMYNHHIIQSKNIFDAYTNARVGGSVLAECMRMKHGNMKEALLCYNGSTWDEDAVYANKVFRFSKEFAI